MLQLNGRSTNSTLNTSNFIHYLCTTQLTLQLLLHCPKLILTLSISTVSAASEFDSESQYLSQFAHFHCKHTFVYMTPKSTVSVDSFSLFLASAAAFTSIKVSMELKLNPAISFWAVRLLKLAPTSLMDRSLRLG